MLQDAGRGLRILGFPVHVGVGALLAPLLLFGIGGRLDLQRIAIGVVAYLGFMLVHELGHAVVARKYGSKDVSISLDFLVGYARFVPPEGISRRRLAGISVAGPAAEIAAGMAVLAALGVNPLSFSRPDGWIASIVWWFGPVLGLLNLAPVFPLDGGHIVAQGLDWVLPNRGRELWQKASLGLAGLLVVGSFTNPTLSRYRFLGIMLLVMNLSSMGGSPKSTGARRRNDRTQQRTLAGIESAEHQAWTTGRPGLFPPGFGPSPWFHAHQRQVAGDNVGAWQTLHASLTLPSGAWSLPEDLPLQPLAALADLVPPDAPVDQVRAGFELQSVLHRLGRYSQAASYGARLFERHRQPIIAHNVAGSLTKAGQLDAAMAWLRVAMADPDEVNRLDDPDLAALRTRADFPPTSNS